MCNEHENVIHLIAREGLQAEKEAMEELTRRYCEG